MSSKTKGGRRPVVYWAVCPECLTYIWVDESQVIAEETPSCPYCDRPISLLGGQELANSCRQLQALNALVNLSRTLDTLLGENLPAALGLTTGFSQLDGD